MRKANTIISDRLLFLIFALFFLTGITAGAFISRMTDFSPGSGVFSPNLFVRSFFSFMKPCTIIFMSSFFKYRIFPISATLIYRGGIFGFVSACIMKTYGIGRAISATLPQNILFFPCIFSLCVFSLSGRKIKPWGYIVIYGLILAICTLCALADTYITSLIIRTIF